MPSYTAQELSEALGAIDSIIHKCEKAQEKFPKGNSHHTLLRNRLKALYISKELITQALAKKPKPLAVDQAESVRQLMANLEQLHTTKLGAERVKKNLQLEVADIVDWCKEKIQSPHSQIVRRGKNWYITADGCEITVNVLSYTIITAHRCP